MFNDKQITYQPLAIVGVARGCPARLLATPTLITPIIPRNANGGRVMKLDERVKRKLKLTVEAWDVVNVLGTCYSKIVS